MSAKIPEFIITRAFDAPIDLVWRAWTIPELMAKWWGPKGFTVGKYTMDLRPGGTYHYSIVGTDGKAMWGKFVYREVTALEKLVFVNCFSDEQGGVTRHPFHATWPLETLTTITLVNTENKTQVTIHWVPLNATETELKTFADGMSSMQQGWTGTLDQLELFLTEQRNKQ